MAHTEKRPTDRTPPAPRVETRPAQNPDEVNRSAVSFLVTNVLDPAVGGAVGSAVTIAASKLSGRKGNDKPTAQISPPPASKSE